MDSYSKFKLSGNLVSDIGLERMSVILMLLTTSPARLILTSLFYKFFNPWRSVGKVSRPPWVRFKIEMQLAVQRGISKTQMCVCVLLSDYNLGSPRWNVHLTPKLELRGLLNITIF